MAPYVCSMLIAAETVARVPAPAAPRASKSLAGLIHPPGHRPCRGPPCAQKSRAWGQRAGSTDRTVPNMRPAPWKQDLAQTGGGALGAPLPRAGSAPARGAESGSQHCCTPPSQPWAPNGFSRVPPSRRNPRSPRHCWELARQPGPLSTAPPQTSSSSRSEAGRPGTHRFCPRAIGMR